MSLTYGFYNSQNGDRKYDSETMSGLFDGIITDGVFESIGDKLMVSEGSGMTVNVGTGRAWFNRTWTYNDSQLPVTISASEIILHRIDTIAIDVNKLTRTNSIVVVKGTPASNPVAPSLTLDSGNEHYQYALCDIYVGAGVTKIEQSKITNRVGVDCPFVTAATEHVTVDGLVAQWEAEFDAWMATLVGVIGDNAATNLANEILALKSGKMSTNGSTPMTGNLDINSYKVVNVSDPSNLTDAANKRYVDSKSSKFQCIWENASPASICPEQYISFTTASSYDAVMIRCRYGINNHFEQSIIIYPTKGGTCSFTQTKLWGTDRKLLLTRSFIFDSEKNSIHIGPSYSYSASADKIEEQGGNYVIPVAIYGIKW